MTRQAVGLAGAGAVALGMAVLASQNGHKATVWSPSGGRAKGLRAGEPLIASGAIEGQFAVSAAGSAAELADGAETIVLALPAYGHRPVMEMLAPHLHAGHMVIISSHASFGALHLAALLAERGITIPIVAWGTTVVSGRERDGGVVINTVRARVDACVVPDAHADKGLAVCRELFGDRFVPRDGLLAITLSNLNPQNHMGIALANMTRMERGETWGQGENVTPNVGRLLEALDAERLAVARVLNLDVKTIHEHFHQSFHVPIASIHAMNQAMHARGVGGTGPSDAESRYVTEDVPYGLVPIAKLARLARVPAPLHEAGIAIFSAMYGRDFLAENDLLTVIDFDRLQLGDLRRAGESGTLPANKL